MASGGPVSPRDFQRLIEIFQVYYNYFLRKGEKTNINEARKELLSLLGEDVMFDSRGEEQVYMRGKKITFFAVMKEKTFTKVYQKTKKCVYLVTNLVILTKSVSDLIFINLF